MTDVLGKGADIVRSAESSLRELLQLAAAERQYDRAAILARWADQVSRITGSNGDGAAPKAANVNPALRVTKPRTLRRASRRRRQLAAKYPVFQRSGENLVKVAWSKAAKSEYVHQAPRSVINDLIAAIYRVVADDDLVSIENVLPLARGDGADTPVYQVYVCLAWLRHIGAVKQHGRRGYSVNPKGPVDSLVDRAWAALSVHRP